MTSNTDDDNIEIIGGDHSRWPRRTQRQVVDGSGRAPAKVTRIGTMIQPLEKCAPRRWTTRAATGCATSTAPASRARGRAGAGLREELERLALPFTEDAIPWTPNCGPHQAELVGWLEGLFHGIETALFAQQMAAPSAAGAIRQLPRGAVPGQRGGGPGWRSTCRSCPPHIETDNAWVEFPIFDAKTRSLKKAPRQGRRRHRAQRVQCRGHQAMRDTTMSLDLGDRMGLVGHNGAGKSTLLRLLSESTSPPRGGVGDRPGGPGVRPWRRDGPGDLRIENIIIRGLSLGQTRKQMLAKVDEIAEFTELGDYLSMPRRTYSTGMRVRCHGRGHQHHPDPAA